MEPAVEYRINWKLLDKQRELPTSKPDNDFIKADDIQIRKDKYGWYCSARSEINTYFMICHSTTFDEFLEKMLRSFTQTNEAGTAFIDRESVCAEADSLDDLRSLANQVCDNSVRVENYPDLQEIQPVPNSIYE